jgi:tRNA pseudouridine38-40 synthase
MNYALILAYRGGRYSGWQRQKNALTVQEVVEEALSDLLAERIRVHGASRTDAGVHARGQVAHLEIDREFPEDAFLHGTNQRLPDDVRVMSVRRVPEDFHARKSALSKEYRYRLMQVSILSPLDAPFAVQVKQALEMNRLRAATACLTGRHDFSAFALAGGGHGQPVRRILSAEWVESGSRLELHVVGDGFLRGMVRSIVGTLLEVGRGRLAVDTFRSLLEGGERADAGPTAPAHGLVLQEVHYPQDLRLHHPRSGPVGVLD